MRRSLLLGALAVSAALLASPAGALAVQENHPFLGVVGAASYEDACGLALGGGGLYVSDYYHDQVDLPGGGKIESEDPNGGPCKLALDSGGDLYVYNWHHDVVEFAPSEIPQGPGVVIDPKEPTEAERPTGLALDPETGDLYVAHRTYIARYAAPVHAGETPAIIGANEHAAYYGIAFSNFAATKGYLYVPDAASRTVAVFDPATDTEHPKEAITGEATPQGGFKDLTDSEALIDNSPASSSYGHLFVLDHVGTNSSGKPEGVFDELNAEGDYRGQVKGFEDAEPSGIAIEASGPSANNVYVTSGNTEGSAVFKYGPTAPARKLTVTKTGNGGGTVRSSPLAGIVCGGACVAEFNEGEKVELFAAPDAHSVFKGWSGGGCTGAGSCTVIMSANLEVHAEFEEPLAQQTLTVSETGAGTVTSEPAGIHCPSACSEHFNEGRIVTLTATPAPHSRFAEWVGVACDESTQRTCQITMSSAESIAAKFVPIPQQTLTASLSGAGSGEVTSFPAGISCPGSCSAGFDEGSSVTLTASPDPGSEFAGWSGACSGTTTVCAVAMAEALSVGAEFSAAPPGSQASAAGKASLAASLPGPALRASSGTAPGGHRKHRRQRHRHHHRRHRRR